MLKLDNPSTFAGEIFNFTGNGSLPGSDQVDLRTISFDSVHDSYGTGVLMVTDGTNIANQGS
jgi:serralysin